MNNRRTKVLIAAKILSVILLLIFSVSACRIPAVFKTKSGTRIEIEVKTDEPNAEQITDRAVRILQNRLNALGMDGEISKSSPNKIEAKIYTGANVPRVREILLAESRFELRKVVSPPSPAPLQTFPTKESATQFLGGIVPSNRKILRFPDTKTNDSERWIIVENPSIVDGSELRDASAMKDLGRSDGGYEITFSLNPSGAQKFGDWTAKNIGNYVGIILNDEVRSAAFIRSQIFDSGIINGRFNKQQAEDLALVMKSGYLPATLEVIDEKTFGQ
ncbi:MAG: preprotein translocase subunit SecD [Pyrinomonadaceae bacterium]